jgi:hypothetical protein
VQNDWDALFSGRHIDATVVNNFDNGVTWADALLENPCEKLRAYRAQ